ncbi:hypothetical protein BDN71DRAFT_1431202 [Pleurotus eryngii]|uniref:Uncharacterized protein n=1 Tax=Pleurotus eryngii TaxID=5323 RepID=A0A9P5ZXT8_PLEER|nr:hypothetical protein BDN71DRAFT_1431202 [Pleurotus eryngii]
MPTPSLVVTPQHPHDQEQAGKPSAPSAGSLAPSCMSDKAPAAMPLPTPRQQVDEPADDPSDVHQPTNNSSLAEMSAHIFIETLQSPMIRTRDNKVWLAPLHCCQVNQSTQFLQANDEDIASLVSSFCELNIGSSSSQSPSPTLAPASSAEQTLTLASTSPPRTPQRALQVNHLVTRHLCYISNIEKQAEVLWKSLPISGSTSLMVLSDVEAQCIQLVTDLDKLKHTDPEVKQQRLEVAEKLHNLEAHTVDLCNAHTHEALGPTIICTGCANTSSLSKLIKPYVYHHFSDYMAGLLSSKKDEESMDRACDDTFASAYKPPPEQISNIFQGSFLRFFIGPDGKLFIDHGTEGHYVHALNIDFFDAEGMTVQGASASWGLFSTSCLNLPDSEMHKPEKICVQAGIGMSTTLALRCILRGVWLAMQWRYDPQNWVPHDPKAMYEIACSFRDAPTVAKHLSIFAQFKVRWTKLWRLPYYDPVCQLVVNVMHAVYENWLEFFYRDTLRLTSVSANATPKCILTFKLAFLVLTQEETHNFNIDQLLCGQLKLISNALTIPFVLDSAPDPVVVSSSCVMRPMEAPKTKAACILALIAWHTAQPLTPNESLFKKHFATPETMAHIRNVIKNTTMPSWFNKPPQAFGEAATGTPKADKWRSMSSIYLPLALCMTTAQIAEAYRQCISAWTKQFYEVFPMASLHTNLHMAFHIYEFLLLFSPAYSWWTFPFESLIRVIQRTKSNHKHGEMESTLVNSFIQAGVLRHWLDRDDCPKPIHEFKALFDRVFTPRWQNEVEEKGMSVDSRKQTTSCKTPADLLATVKTPRVVLCASTCHKGTILARASTHVGSSLVSFYPGGDSSVPPVPGSIQYIIEGECRLQLVIRRQRSLPDSVADPFWHWPYVLITLYLAAMEPELEIVELDWMIRHVGRYPYSAEFVTIIRVHHQKPFLFVATCIPLDLLTLSAFFVMLSHTSFGALSGNHRATEQAPKRNYQTFDLGVNFFFG